MVSMNRLSIEKRAAIVAALVEGNSIRATCRMTGASKNTVTKLLVDLGYACGAHHDRTVRRVKSERIQCDEIWSFCFAKQKNVQPDKVGELGYGDVWTWTALDADSKLMVTYYVGKREDEDARLFLGDLAQRLAGRVQLTTDGWHPYLKAVKETFGLDVDFAQMIKVYGRDLKEGTQRYSPPVCTGTDIRVRIGDPDRDAISTSYIERQNLTMRMSMRRFTRLTNAHSKKLENLTCAVALHFAHYNFCRVHSTLKTTPAVAAGIADHVWTLKELIGLLEAIEDAQPRERAPYKKRQKPLHSN
jgi:IS1 family transposase